MALQSRLFRGDPKLEAAAISDAAHITQGAAGEHVRKIQLALIQLDGATIVADGKYGPATAKAVLAYKRKRNIINRAFQSQADNIVGKMTIDRLDKEMLAAERSDQCTPRCLFLPDTQQSTRRSFTAGHGLVGAASSAAAVGDAPGELTGFMLLADKDASLPLAKSWIASTLTKISQVEGKIERFKVYTAADIAFFSSIETHFKVEIPNVSESVARERLRKIKQMFLKIQNVLNVIGPGSTRVMGNPGVPDKGLGPLGGIDIPTQFITIGRDFHNANANMRAAVLIHEGGHFADASCSHAASEQPAPNGSPILDRFGTAVNPGRLNYAQLDFNLHMQNAYSFAQCAMH
ncbi:MAG: peptidoglycan-binding protein, partial [Alphaproteobacteria bacterium]|nr:peptidoglycan-binding protein [Alphaproteobacteria bacterium]